MGEIVKDGTGHVAKLKLAELFTETELVSFHDKKMWAAMGRTQDQEPVSLYGREMWASKKLKAWKLFELQRIVNFSGKVTLQCTVGQIMPSSSR